MAVVLGINAGFVTVAPIADPAGNGLVYIDGYAIATKDTSPAGAIRITEIGFWADNATPEANFEVAIYTHDVGDDEPLTILAGADKTNAKGTDAGWKVATGLNIAISPNTIYWIAYQLDSTSPRTIGNQAASGGRRGYKSVSTLPDPNWGDSILNDAKIEAVYAVVEVAVGTNMQINIADVWKDIEELKINIGDAWKNVIKVQQNIGDDWKTVFG